MLKNRLNNLAGRMTELMGVVPMDVPSDACSLPAQGTQQDIQSAFRCEGAFNLVGVTSGMSHVETGHLPGSIWARLILNQPSGF